MLRFTVDSNSIKIFQSTILNYKPLFLCLAPSRSSKLVEQISNKWMNRWIIDGWVGG